MSSPLPTPMESRAWENLAAAQVLLTGDEPSPNASASRAYYAAYHAVWVCMVAADYPVPSRPGGRYFGHKDLPDDALEARILDDVQADTLAFLEGRRVKADYATVGVDLDEAGDCVDRADSLLKTILGDP